MVSAEEATSREIVALAWMSVALVRNAVFCILLEDQFAALRPYCRALRTLVIVRKCYDTLMSDWEVVYNSRYTNPGMIVEWARLATLLVANYCLFQIEKVGLQKTNGSWVRLNGFEIFDFNGVRRCQDSELLCAELGFSVVSLLVNVSALRIQVVALEVALSLVQSVYVRLV